MSSHGLIVASAVALFAGAALTGCMTSRGICRVSAPGEVRRPVTRNHYRITQIQERLADGRIVNVHSNRRMREMLDQSFDLEDLMSCTPGVWAKDGIPVTVTFVKWQNDFGFHWSIMPCILTLGICPYCHHEEIYSRVEVSRDDGKGSGSFAYAERDDWKMSVLFALGSIPYDEEILARNEFQLCGHGDVLNKPHIDGLAHGIAAVLSEMERQADAGQNNK